MRYLHQSLRELQEFIKNKNMKKIYLLLSLTMSSIFMFGQAGPDQNKMGAWYMYFYNTTFNESCWGIQGDIQYRNWNTFGDLEQLLIRSGITYQPKNEKIKFTLGYANITTGEYGSSSSTVNENRIYQEAIFPSKFGKRFYLTHRFRFEQRLNENQNLRTRYRYNLFMNVPLNSTEMEKNTLYLALYNELFINGQRDIGNSNSVELFDRNRAYVALGFHIKNNLKVQLGVMKQATNNWVKNQLQLSLHHKI